MNFFSYKPNGQLGKAWSLFSQLGELSTEDILTDGRHSYAHTWEIIQSALAGSISLEDEDILSFNLKAYETACRVNDKIFAKKHVEKELFIVDSVGEDNGERVQFGDISERKLKSYDAYFDEMLDESSFGQSIEELCNLRRSYIINEGVDVVELLYNALKGIKDASEMLVDYVKRDSKLSDVIVGICEYDNHDEIMHQLSLKLGGV